jgi:tetratricopeptide (TPR) repeat protein
MTRRRSVLAFASLALAVAGVAEARAPEAGELFAKGVAAYGERRYEDAAKSFEAVRQLGLDGAELEYDLGSAYYRIGDVGRAIAAFRRAERFAPRDPDVRENLSMALERAKDPLPQTSELPWDKAIAAWRRSLSLAEEKTLFLSAYALAAALLLGSLLFLQKALRRAGIVAGAVALLLGVSYLTRLHGETARPHAVVVDPKVDVRTGPGEDYQPYFLLHAGAELRVEELQGGWAKISISADRKGWLPASAIERI